MKEKLCDTCIYRNNVEQLKPCIIYRDDCEYYEKEREDMTDDLISRQAVQDYIAEYLSQYLYNDVREAVEVIDEYIGELPPVNPQEPSETIHGSTYGGVSWGGTYKPQEPKTGHWIWKDFDDDTGISKSYWCSKCNKPLTGLAMNYCGCCGCRMVEPRESEDKE